MSFFDWIYPPRCMACKQILPIQEKEWRKFRLCAKCRALFERLRPPLCKRCGNPLEENAYAADTNITPAKNIGDPAALSGGNNAGTNTADDDNADDSGGLGSIDFGCPACFGRDYIFERNLSFFPYDGVLRDILLDIKFNSRKQYAIGLGELWASVLDEKDFPAPVNSPSANTILVPVPMHPRKARSRGFNQAEILAEAVAKKSGAEMKTDLLKRTVNTPPQSGLTPRRRAENVRGVFKLNSHYNIEGKNIILIDDIFTTGASLNACAEILAESGADKIICMTLAVAVKNRERSADI